jgi:hypothetical protein
MFLSYISQHCNYKTKIRICFNQEKVVEKAISEGYSISNICTRWRFYFFVGMKDSSWPYFSPLRLAYNTNNTVSQWVDENVITWKKSNLLIWSWKLWISQGPYSQRCLSPFCSTSTDHLLAYCKHLVPVSKLWTRFSIHIHIFNIKVVC